MGDRMARRQYLVQWVGGGETWEFEAAMQQCNYKIDSLRKSAGKPVPSDGAVADERLAEMLEG